VDSIKAKNGLRETIIYKAPKPFGEGWFCLDRYNIHEDGFRSGLPTIFGDLDSLKDKSDEWLMSDEEEEFWRKVNESYKAMKADKAFWEAELE